MMTLPYLDLKRINSPYEADFLQAYQRILSNGWYLFGEEVATFEQEWAAYIGTRHCIACANGLDALRLVLRAWIEMGCLQQGDEVIVPANTYIASILAISDCGLTPVPVEPDPHTYLLTVEGAQRALSSRTRAILPVHLYGQACRMDALTEWAQAHQLKVLEDCAQSHGAWSTKHVTGSDIPCRTGACGDAGAFSFYPGKNLGALGDAGAVTTDDDTLATVIRQIAFYGSTQKYVHRYKGINSRMDECQAAVLRIKMRDLDACTLRRQTIARTYNTGICHPDILLPQAEGDHVYHIYPVLTPHRNRLQQYLAQCGIATQIHYPIAPHQQEAYREWQELHLPVTEHIAAQELSLPLHQAMTDREAEAVVTAINAFRP